MCRKAAVGDQTASSGMILFSSPMSRPTLIGLSSRFQPVGSALAPFRHAGWNLREIRRAPFSRCLAVAERGGNDPASASARVARERDIGPGRAADFLRQISIWMTGLPARDQREALGGDFAELAADHQKAIRRRDKFVGDPRITPEYPAESGCVQAIAPLPDIVCATGMPWLSASAEQSLVASEICMPPPARMSGRSALASRRARDRDPARPGASGGLAPSACRDRPRNPPHRNRIRHARRPQERRSAPARAGRMSRS